MSTLRESPAPPLATWPARACEGADPKLFFPGRNGGGRNRTWEGMAKAFCYGCPARRACLAYALPIVDLSGIWAGFNENERTRMRKKSAAGGAVEGRETET